MIRPTTVSSPRQVNEQLTEYIIQPAISLHKAGYQQRKVLVKAVETTPGVESAHVGADHRLWIYLDVPTLQHAKVLLCVVEVLYNFGLHVKHAKLESETHIPGFP